MIKVSLSEQENNLIELSKAVEYQAKLIKQSLKEKKFAKCILDTAGLLSLLKINILTPSNYYLLFTDICDILEETIEFYIREKTLRGIKIKYIYDSVQQSQFLIPRLYLMIISGSIYLEQNPLKYREILYDLINMVKCEQNPLTAFWLRYFLFKYIKDKLPIKNGDYINNNNYYFDYMKISINFLMENLEYINHYILRIRKELFIDNEILNKKERENMILCEQEIIEEISNIKGLIKNNFENKILPKFIEMILDSENDWYIQQILMESIIKYFKIDLYFESQGIYIILFTISRLMSNKEIDIVNIYINLLNSYKKFIKSKKLLNSKIRNERINKIKNIYHLFLLKYNELQINYNNSGEKEFNKFIDLDIIFMKFSFKILVEKNENRLKIINHIMDLCSKRIDFYKKIFSVNSIKKICSLISISLKRFTMYELAHFDKLIIYLDYNSRKEIGFRIIQNLTNKYNKDYYIDNIEKVQKLIDLIFPLITEIKDDNEDNSYQKYSDENEKNIYLCKLLSIIKSNKPEIMVEIFMKIKNFLETGPSQTQFYNMKSLIYYIICFMNKLELFYNYKFINISEENKDNKSKNEIINYFDIDNESNKEKINEYFIRLMKDIINILKESIIIIKKQSPEFAFKLYLLSFNQMNKMKYIYIIDKKIFLEQFQYFFDEALNILRSYKNDNDNDLNIKYNLFIYLCGYLPSFTYILNKDKINNIIEIFESEIGNINDTKFQFDILLNISNLYFLIYKDKEKVFDYLNKCFLVVKKDLNANININLSIKLTNKIIFYMEKDYKDNNLKDLLNNIIKEVKDSEILLKQNNIDIYNYYKRTIDLINERKI